MELTPEICARLFPELRNLDFEIHPLKGGITNKLYRLISRAGHDYVFRLYGAKTELLIDRDAEAENLRRLEPLGFTQKLIKYLPEVNITVVEFIHGTAIKNEDFLKENLWEFIIRPIKLIHRSGIVLPFRFDPLVEVKRLYKILKETNPNYSEFDIEGTIQIMEKISESAEILSLRYVSCHNDLLADNFILASDNHKDKEPMYLIDWEYAGMAPLYYDLADMFQEILVPREVERNLLRIYWDNQDISYHEYVTDLFKPFPDIYWFLWSLIQLNVSNINFDYYNYGKIKYENAQKNIRYLRNHYGVKI